MAAVGPQEPDADRQGAHHGRDQAARRLILRVATEGDQVALLELERAANLVALAHVFGDRPYPADDVLARWAIVLADPSCTTLVLDGASGGLDGLVTTDGTAIRHLAVHPDRWGTGLARLLLEAAVDLTGRPVTLWVLDLNHRARGLYEHLGWRPSGMTRPSVFAPYPEELEYRLDP